MNLETLKAKLPSSEDVWYEVTKDYVIKHYNGMWDSYRSIVRFEPNDTEDSVVQKFKNKKDEKLNNTHYDLD